jgi:hypothetical protein
MRDAPPFSRLLREGGDFDFFYAAITTRNGAPPPAAFAGSGDFTIATDLKPLDLDEVRELRIRARIYPCRKSSGKTNWL